MDVIASHGRLSSAGRDFVARRHKLLIDGQWVNARSSKTFAVFDPSNGQQIAQVAEGGAKDEDLAAAHPDGDEVAFTGSTEVEMATKPSISPPGRKQSRPSCEWRCLPDGVSDARGAGEPGPPRAPGGHRIDAAAQKSALQAVGAKRVRPLLDHRHLPHPCHLGACCMWAAAPAPFSKCGRCSPKLAGCCWCMMGAGMTIRRCFRA